MWLLSLLAGCSESQMIKVEAAADAETGDGGTLGVEDESTVPPNCRQDYGEATLISVESAFGFVYAIDPATAEVHALSALDDALEAEANLNSSAFQEDGGALVSDSGLRRMLELDPCSGALTVLGDTGVGALCGIAFGPGGKLYGLDGEYDQLVTLDPVTGAGTVVGPLGFELGGCGLAYDCVEDELYGIDGTGMTYFHLDPLTGAASGFVSVDVPFSSVGAEYDPRDQTLLASTGTELYRIGVADGSSTRVGAYGAQGYWDDLAYYTAELTCE